MKTFITVEDYIEVIGGARDIVTGKLTSSWFMSLDPIISLARYDVDVLQSMCESTLASKPLTERQGDLACKIILKYQRQLANKGVDVSPVETPAWRVPLRKMDYSRSLDIQDDKIALRFPFVTKLVEDLRAFRKDSQGSCEFDREAKVWKIGLTEYNLTWLHTWASANEFKIGEQVQYLIDKMLEVEQSGFAIELYCNGTSLDISNCPDSLRDYINTKLGGFGFDNLATLVDYSGELGYTIQDDLKQAVMQQWGPRFLQLASHRDVKINPNTGMADDDFASVLDYAIQVGRTPVVIYEPDLSLKMFNRLKELYPAEQILDVGNGKFVLDHLTPEIKFIYTVKPMRVLDRIPLLISSAGMIFGGDKQLMMQKAGKAIYTAAEVYNKKQTGQKVIKIGS